MADKITLKLDNIALELTNDQYKLSYRAVDDKKTAEAGNTLRNVTRSHIRSLSVSYKGTASEKAILDANDKKSSLTATLWDEETASEITWECFMSGYSADLIVESPTERFYKFGFKLEDLEEN